MIGGVKIEMGIMKGRLGELREDGEEVVMFEGVGG